MFKIFLKYIVYCYGHPRGIIWKNWEECYNILFQNWLPFSILNYLMCNFINSISYNSRYNLSNRECVVKRCYTIVYDWPGTTLSFVALASRQIPGSELCYKLASLYLALWRQVWPISVLFFSTSGLAARVLIWTFSCIHSWQWPRLGL